MHDRLEKVLWRHEELVADRDRGEVEEPAPAQAHTGFHLLLWRKWSPNFKTQHFTSALCLLKRFKVQVKVNNLISKATSLGPSLFLLAVVNACEGFSGQNEA